MKALIVDDEHHCIENLSLLIREYCPEITSIRSANSVDQGLKEFEANRPDLLFLDIQMPGRNGFTMLEDISLDDIALVFVTAFDQYAIKAIELGPCGYLLKPIDIEKLKKAVARAKTEIHKNVDRSVYQNAIDHVVESIRDKSEPTKICLTQNSKIEVVPIKDIVYLSADNYYTTFHLTGGREILMSKTLKHYSSILGLRFVRVHRTYLASISKIKELTKNQSQLLMANGDLIPISRRQLKHVRSAIQNI